MTVKEVLYLIQNYDNLHKLSIEFLTKYHCSFILIKLLKNAHVLINTFTSIYNIRVRVVYRISQAVALAAQICITDTARLLVW